ncbi:MAG: DNA mismatch repair endonuclease MutL [Chloroflexi bacterium]|nr:DNA mismatch repair endonuclease MutL [Chloroflexota bacterium]
MPIRVLDEKVASQIAAGEVVERPASAVKELIENAIDAGASEIKIEVRGGGRRLIRVIDDGSGIPAEEAELAFARHSTSKLSSAEDLRRITTLGFRGEALPSIASVSRLTMLTRPREQSEGILLRIEGGKMLAREKRGSPPGTVVTVSDLFYNTPARLKFLRQDSTETGHIADLVMRYAFAQPRLKITLLADGRTLFRSPGSGDLFETVVAAWGAETAKQLLPVEENEGGLRVSGLVGAPSLHRANSRQIVLLVNGRSIRDQSLSFALRQAYHTLLPTGRYPVAVLHLLIPPEEVDVNVHPAKTEVRFQKANEVFAAVQRAVRHTLTAGAPVPRISRPLAPETQTPQRQIRWATVAADTEGRKGQLSFEVHRQPQVDEKESPRKMPPLRVLGQLAATYIISEGPGGMYLVDQHAAHERILYERLLAEGQGQGINSQGLLEPLTMELTPAEAGAVEEHRTTLAQWGFEIEPFGGATYLLRAVPAVLTSRDPVKALHLVLDEAAQNSAKWEEAFVISLACHSAVRAGQTLGEQEMRDLLRQLEETESPRTCAHGRPTMIHMSAEQLEKEFRRR